jgi:hypothetical protein
MGAGPAGQHRVPLIALITEYSEVQFRNFRFSGDCHSSMTERLKDPNSSIVSDVRALTGPLTNFERNQLPELELWKRST